MRNFIVPAILAASLALGSAAVAATPAAHAAAPAAVTKTTVTKATVTKASVTKASTKPVAANGKEQACETNWKAQKTHNGTRTAFMKACVAKG